MERIREQLTARLQGRTRITAHGPTRGEAGEKCTQMSADKTQRTAGSDTPAGNGKAEDSCDKRATLRGVCWGTDRKKGRERSRERCGESRQERTRQMRDL